MSRILLTAPTTFYIRNVGSDTTGDGSLANPWATPQHVADVLQGQYDLGGQPVTINCSDPGLQEVYPGLIIQGPWVGANGGAGQVKFVGGPYSNSVVFRPPPGANCCPVNANNDAAFTLQGIGLDGINVPGCDGLAVTLGARVDLIGCRWENINNGPSNVANLITADLGGVVMLQPSTEYYVIGNLTFQAAFFASDGGNIRANTNGNPGLITLQHNANPTVTAGYLAVFNGTVQMEAVTFTGGAVAGPYYYALGIGCIDKMGTTLPGSLPGVVVPGSYIYLR